MKITHNKVGQNINSVDGAKQEKTDATKALKDAKSASILSSSEALNEGAGQNAATKVEVSDRAIEARKIKDLANAAPDIDQEKVEKFRRLVDSGEYKVDAKAVADRMVDEHLESGF